MSPPIEFCPASGMVSCSQEGAKALVSPYLKLFRFADPFSIGANTFLLRASAADLLPAVDL